MTSYYLAPSLAALRTEVNRRWPARDTKSDGWIGDPAHSVRFSQHNPNSHGAVTALDIDSDGIDAAALILTLIRDSRTWYVIHKGLIYQRMYGFKPRVYTGANPHNGHVHVSIQQNRVTEDNGSVWFVPEPKPAPKPAPRPKPAKYPPTLRRRALTKSQLPYLRFIQRWLGLTDDGIWGPQTAAAIKRWKRANRIPALNDTWGRACWAKIPADRRPK